MKPVTITALFLVTVLFFAGSLPAFSQSPDVPARVWNIQFKGNDRYADMVLKQQIATEAPTFWEKLQFWDRSGHELDKTKIKKDVIRLGNFYRRRGFINVEVSYKIKNGGEDRKKKVIFVIDENKPVIIRELDYRIEAGGTQGNIRRHPSFQKAQRRLPFREGDRFQPVKEAEVVGEFTEVLRNLGYAYADVSVKARIDTSALTANVTIFARPGPKTYIDSIRVLGEEKLSKTYILEEAALHAGEPYSLRKLQEAQQQLFNHHLIRFATVSIPPQPRDSSLILLLRIRENETRSIALLAGFGTEEKLRGQLSWTHRNAFGRAHRFTITARASFIEQSLNLDYLFPYFINTKSSIVISPFAQHLLQENYELLRGGVTNSYIYRYSETFTASAAYEFTKNKELSREFAASLPDTAIEYDLSSLQFSSYYTSGFGRLEEGWVIQPYAEFSGLFGFATYQFNKFSADVRRYVRLGSSTMMAMRVQAGGMFSVSTDSLPRQIRFYLGGTNSVRGWSRQELGPKRAVVDNSEFVRYVPLGGRAKFGFNLELRQSLGFLIEGIGFAVFLDGGQVWQSLDRLENRPIQFGAGAGIRYQSPIGPLRIDIGYKLNPTNEDLGIYNGRNYGGAWDRIGIHLSIGQAF